MRDSVLLFSCLSAALILSAECRPSQQQQWPDSKHPPKKAPFTDGPKVAQEAADDTQLAYQEFINTWLKQASLALNRPNLARLVSESLAAEADQAAPPSIPAIGQSVVQAALLPPQQETEVFVEVPQLPESAVVVEPVVEAEVAETEVVVAKPIEEVVVEESETIVAEPVVAEVEPEVTEITEDVSPIVGVVVEEQLPEEPIMLEESSTSITVESMSESMSTVSMDANPEVNLAEPEEELVKLNPIPVIPEEELQVVHEFEEELAVFVDTTLDAQESVVEEVVTEVQSNDYETEVATTETTEFAVALDEGDSLTLTMVSEVVDPEPVDVTVMPELAEEEPVTEVLLEIEEAAEIVEEPVTDLAVDEELELTTEFLQEEAVESLVASTDAPVIESASEPSEPTAFASRMGKAFEESSTAVEVVAPEPKVPLAQVIIPNSLVQPNPVVHPAFPGAVFVPSSLRPNQIPIQGLNHFPYTLHFFPNRQHYFFSTPLGGR